MEKFSKSTFSERKIMSTKTSIKRIAAVAAVALTLGGFSAVSAHAAITYAAATPFSVTTADSGVTADLTTVGTTFSVGAVAGAGNYVLFTAGADTASGSTAVVTTSGAGSSISVGGSSTATWTDNSSTGVAATTVSSSSNTISGKTVKVLTPTVGTITVTFAKSVANANGSFTNTTLQTATITVNAASVVGTLSAANSKSYISDSSTVYASISTIKAAALSADSTVLAPAGTTPAKVASIQVTLKDTQATPAVVTGGKVLSASITGSGLIDGTGSTDDNLLTDKPARVATSTTNTISGIGGFVVYSDGTSGVGTITISQGTTVIATKTVTFYGSKPATVVGTQNLSVAAAATALGYAGNAGTSVAATPAITIAAKDSNGNLVAGLSTGWTAASSDTTCISKSVSVFSETSAGDGAGYYAVQVNGAAGAVSGCKATLTLTWTSADALTSVSTAAFPFTVGGTTIYGLAFSSDASTYGPGDKVTLTLSATDKSGNPVADQAYSVFASITTPVAFAGLTTSAAITSTLFATASGAGLDFVSGKKTATFYAPYTSGTMRFSGALGGDNIAAALALTTPVAGTISVANPADAASQAAVDAANEATDAANAATDAANNAMDSADAAQQAALDAGDKADAALAAVTDLASKVADIATQISALSSLVSKIAASVAKISAKVKA
jgi:hypothetical protein